MGRSRTSAKAEVLSFAGRSAPAGRRGSPVVLIAAALVAVAVPGVERCRRAEDVRTPRRAMGRRSAAEQRRVLQRDAARRPDGRDVSGRCRRRDHGRPGDKCVSTYIRANGQAGASRAAFTGRIIAGIVAGGDDPQAFGGVDYVAILNSQYDQTTGAFESRRLRLLLEPHRRERCRWRLDGDAAPQAVAYIRSNECAGGGFSLRQCVRVRRRTGHDGTGGERARRRRPRARPAVIDARTFVLSRQSADGGFGVRPGSRRRAATRPVCGLTLDRGARRGGAGRIRGVSRTATIRSIALLGLQDAAGAIQVLVGRRDRQRVHDRQCDRRDGRSARCRSAAHRPLCHGHEPTPTPNRRRGTRPRRTRRSDTLPSTSSGRETARRPSSSRRTRSTSGSSARSMARPACPAAHRSPSNDSASVSTRSRSARSTRRGTSIGSPASDAFKVVRKRKR